MKRTMFESQNIWMNGKLVDHQDATLHFLTAGLHCYATGEGPVVFRLKEHMQRLMHSAAVLGWRELPFTIEQRTVAVPEAVRQILLPGTDSTAQPGVV